MQVRKPSSLQPHAPAVVQHLVPRQLFVHDDALHVPPPDELDELEVL